MRSLKEEDLNETTSLNKDEKVGDKWSRCSKVKVDYVKHFKLILQENVLNYATPLHPVDS